MVQRLAYYFLAGEYNKAFEQINKADGTNDITLNWLKHFKAHI